MQPLLKDDDDGGRVGYISRIVLLSRSNTWQVSCATKVQPLTRESTQKSGLYPCTEMYALLQTS